MNKNNSIYRYDPSIFDKTSLDEAKNIILTKESGVSRDIRWTSETPWLCDLLVKHLPSTASLLLDFGCGVGRMSKVLVDEGYHMVGVDISQTMRQHASNYDIGENFSVLSPRLLDKLCANGLAFDACLSVWVLQHCFDLYGEIDLLYRALKKGGICFVVDMHHRAVPTDKGWIADGINVKEAMLSRFTLLQTYQFSPPDAPKNLAQNAWIGIFTK